MEQQEPAPDTPVVDTPDDAPTSEKQTIPNLTDTAHKELLSLKESLSVVKERMCGERLSNEPKWELGLSSGYSMLNLACTGNIEVAFLPDYYYVWAGQSGSGKTVANLAALAEASINPKFKDHDLIYDAPENGALMNFQRFYGPEMARRVEPPAGSRENPIHSRTLEGFYHNVFNRLQKNPFVYILDSMDALPTDDEWRDFLKKNKERDDGEVPSKESGSYHTERARTNSHYLRLLFNQLQNSNSILIVIFQSRQNIGMFKHGETKGGGNAPTFFAGLELWSKVVGKISTSYKGNSVDQGVICEVEVKKGRITGKNRWVNMPIYDSFGIDDVGGMIDFLTEWKHWSKTGKEGAKATTGKITAHDWNMEPMSREKLVEYILDREMEKDLKMVVGEVWQEIENKTAVNRKSKYHKQE